MSSNTGTVRGALTIHAVALVFGALPALAEAQQTAPEEHAFRGKTEISDVTLGGVRGRYTSADQILYFGVEMYTEWSNGVTNQVVAASLSIGIDRSVDKAHPTVSVNSNVQASNASNGYGAGNGSSGQISSGGLNQVQGVSQVVQVTGNGNGVANAMAVDVTTQTPAMAGASNSAQTGGNKTYVDAQTGAIAQTIVNQEGARIIVSVPTQGTASQAVTRAIGMQQQAQVYGDGNTIHNQLNMVIQVQNNSASATAAQMNNLSQTMRGLWQAGIR